MLEQQAGGMVYFHPHVSEQTSIQAAEKLISKHGGRVIIVENNGECIVPFKLGGKVYNFDPNRIFSRSGVAPTLKKYGPYSKEAEDIVVQFAQWLSGLLSTGRVFAIHNNKDTTYNVLSYRDASGNPIKGIKALFINSKHDPGNFLYTTNMALYMSAKASGFNAVLQGNDVENDGSYSVFAALQSLDYVNVESKIGDLTHDLELITFVNRFYNCPDLTAST